MVSLSGSARDVLAVAHDLEKRGYPKVAKRLLSGVNGHQHNDRVRVPAERKHILIIAGSVMRTGAQLR